MYSPRKLLLSLATVMLLASLSDVSLAQKGGKTTTPKLTLTVSPSTILEGDTATGTVTHNNSNTSTAVTVTLSSSKPSQASVPATITIPAGSNSATFNVTAIDDGTPDGDQAVTISVSATGYSAGSTSITVSDKPIFEYRIEAIPTGSNTNVWINGITNNSRVYGHMYERINGVVVYHSGFVYDQVSHIMYDFNQIPEIRSQVQHLAGSAFELTSIRGMNESGLMVGAVSNSSNDSLPIAIDATVDGEFSPDPADWVVQLLPVFDSTTTHARRINESGDILGHFLRADGKIGAWLYNPWLGGSPVVLPVNLYGQMNHVLNDHAQVAGIDEFRRAFLYDAVTDTIRFFDDANYINMTGLNNSGVFAGYASVTVSTGKGGKTASTSGAFRHDGTTLRLIAGTAGTETSGCLNEAGDVASRNLDGPVLSHFGFSPDYNEQLLDIGKIIAIDDPLKATVLNQSPAVFSINDRDATGYPQLAVVLYFRNASGTNDTKAVILTPCLVP